MGVPTSSTIQGCACFMLRLCRDGAIFCPQARPVTYGITASALSPFYSAPVALPFVRFRLFRTTERRGCPTFPVNSNKNMETGRDLLDRKNRSANYLYRETFFQMELSFKYQK